MSPLTTREKVAIWVRACLPAVIGLAAGLLVVSLR